MRDRLTLTFMALSDPTRRAILAKLALGETTVKDLAKPFDISGPAITKHLKVLENAGLISRGRNAQWRPCRLEIEPLNQVADWVSEYRKIWEESFDRLDAYLKLMTKTTTKTETKTIPKKKTKGKTNGHKR
jgi:DNA-binding transcriptional ArsR family regulator